MPKQVNQYQCANDLAATSDEAAGLIASYVAPIARREQQIRQAVLNSFVATLVGANANDLLKISNKYFAIADFAGFSRRANRLNNLIY